ncbi:ABC-type branched-subunit amino acid transport system substrate-binding protein [Rhizomicrobium palustre]|uniref:ABC-type branched-subunit amino acid transport system substrate-binding protein n=1 Tax=Rhizomicrobium palustre TaxID=189966 RepID=A0A846MY43_9PROT|nr:penicillin-binding protein activator [Rhizomicrobium palustre]NIK88159.1 ABC-type branched-subunit amino acid transport system substrate-binding protein [Rhizomicrobium palustre]
MSLSLLVSRLTRGPHPSRTFAIALCLAIGACTTAPVKTEAPQAAEPPPAPHQVSAETPNFLRLPNTPAQAVPVRVGVILPFDNANAGTRSLAKALMHAAQMALYDSGNRNIILMTAEDTGSSDDAVASAQKLLDQGAEVIVGPLFAGSVNAVAPLARDRGVPVLAFSTDRSVAGNGVYLLSFQPQSEVRRIVTYAAGQGRKKIGALIPQTPYGDVVEQEFRKVAQESGVSICAVARFSPSAGALTDPAATVAKADCDAVLVPQGGTLLRGITQTLAYSNLDTAKVKLLGTGLWYDPTAPKEGLLNGAWFAAPQPSNDDAFNAKYHQTFGSEPPQLAQLAYDAVSLVALLANGTPYHRFTQRAITDPNGFAGVSGIFRFRPDGSIERGLAVLAVEPTGFTLVNPAPTTFQGTHS